MTETRKPTTRGSNVGGVKLFGVILAVALLGGVVALLPGCGDDTRRLAVCANGPIDPSQPANNAREVWIGGGDEVCWVAGAPIQSRPLPANETPATACAWCEGFAATNQDGGMTP